MKNIPYVALLIASFCFSSCGKDATSSNNGQVNNNGTAASNNGSTGSHNNTTSNNGMTVATNSNTGTTSGTTNGTTSGTTGTTGNILTGIDRIVEGTAKTFCELMFNCTSRAVLTTSSFLRRYATQAECEVGYETYYRNVLIVQIAGEISGRIKTDDDRTDLCLAELKTTCNEPGPTPACNNLFEGTVPENGVCNFQGECAQNLRCARSQGSCEGICEVIEPRLCGMQACQSDEYCEYATGTCKAKIVNGGNCFNKQIGCLDGSSCNSANNRAGTCQPWGSVADGQVCNNNSAFCGLRSRCTNSVCTPIEIKQTNDECSWRDICAAGLVCTNISFTSDLGTCLPIRTTGQSCLSIDECKFGTNCDGADKRNEVRGTCIVSLPAGETCTQDLDCANFTCVENICNDPVCIP